MSWLEPIAMYVEEAVVGPVARRDEQNQEEDRTVDAWSVEEICQEEERDHKPSIAVSHFT